MDSLLHVQTYEESCWISSIRNRDPLVFGRFRFGRKYHESSRRLFPTTIDTIFDFVALRAEMGIGLWTKNVCKES